MSAACCAQGRHGSQLRGGDGGAAVRHTRADRMDRRWKVVTVAAQWAVMPADPPPGSALPVAHRPDPDRAGHGYCGADVGEATRVDGQLPGRIRQCTPCRHVLSQRRRAAEAARERALATRRLQRARAAVDRLANPVPGLMSPTMAEAADRAGRHRERGTSVRAMRAGLPSLGRDH